MRSSNDSQDRRFADAIAGPCKNVGANNRCYIELANAVLQERMGRIRKGRN
jgi:hypothetical protein